MTKAPSTSNISLGEKSRELATLSRRYLTRAREPVDFGWLFAELDEYAQTIERHDGTPLLEARVLEVGYGARPFRLLALLGMGVDARGVDMEVPLLHGSVTELREVWRRNGFERLAKSLIRSAVFDHRERRQLRSELARRGHALHLDETRFVVGDAAELEVADGNLDLVVSEDVFEHMTVESLDRLLPRMARWLTPDGLALVRPTIFTGITGGHLVEWYTRNFTKPPKSRKSEPWEHLRRRRFRPNTSLNELSRADFRKRFQAHFEILEERVADPSLGREYMTPEIRAELAAYPDEELFSNQVLFVLRPRSH